MSIKHETITVSGVVIYCDECGERGHEEAYDNTNTLVEEAHRMGWTTDGDDRDLCPECSKKKPKKKERSR